MKFNLYNVVVYIDFVCTWIIIIHNSWRIINNRYKDHLRIHMFGIHVVFVTFYEEPLYRALILYWDFSGLWLDKTSIQTMYMYDKKFYYMYVIKKLHLWDSTQSMPHVSTQETVSETPPSPSPPPSLIPAHSQSEGTPDTTTREAVLVRSDLPPLKPTPVAPSLTKSPSCLLLDQREITDHPPHSWGPCIKDSRISTRSIVSWFDYLLELYIKINCRKHVIVYCIWLYCVWV